MRALMTSLVAAGIAALALGQTSAPSIRLEGAYTDDVHGFALKPPANTERVRETSQRRLVAWVKRDGTNNAIMWTLEVFRTLQTPTSLPVDQYAKTVAEGLAADGQFKVTSTETGKLAGRDSIDIRGVLTNPAKLWRRQTWVRTGPGSNLVLEISGAVGYQAEMDATLSAVGETLKVFDPTAALQKRKENITRTGELLSKLTDDKLKAILASEPYYLLIQHDAKPIGFLKIGETMVKRGTVTGLQVLRGGALKVGTDPVRYTREDLFATSDRIAEQWGRTFMEGAGKTATLLTGSKVGDMLTVQTDLPGKPKAKIDRRDFPELVRTSYMPVAFDVLASRIVERTAGKTYAFAMYNAGSKDFDLRVLTVVGEETIDWAGGKVKCMRLSDQMAADAPETQVWVDQKGMILRMKTAEGLLVEASDRKSVQAAFGNELAELEKP